MKRLIVIGSGLAASAVVALVVAVVASAGNSGPVISDPFAYSVDSGTDSGPGSGLWGDGDSGPKGLNIGCIPGRHYAVAIIVHNQTDQAITILTVGGSQRHAQVIRRVAVQAWPKPAVTGDMLQVGLRKWSRTPGKPLAVPAENDAWLQLNFLMDKCSLIRSYGRLIVSDRLTISYQDSNGATGQERTPPIQRLILTRASKAEIAAYRKHPYAG